MSVFENHYEIWGPASSLATVHHPTDPGIANQIEATGSNTQAEDGSASVFGRYAIEKSVNIAYRKVVDRFGGQHAHFDIIHLRSGRGPTLERALALNSHSSFERPFNVLFYAHRWEGAPPGFTRPPNPCHEQIVGFFRACEEQGYWQWTVLDEVARELGAPEHDYPDPIDSHILRGVCLTLPILQSRDDVQVHIRTRNGVCALATWLSRLLGFVVEVTRRLGDDKDSKPSIVRLGTTDRRVCVKIDTVSEEHPCVMLIGLRVWTKIEASVFLAKLGVTYKGYPGMLKIQRGKDKHRISQGGNFFQYEGIKTLLRIDFNFWIDKKVHGVNRRLVRGLGEKVLEWAAITFVGATGSQDREEWIKNLRTVTILFALDVALHLRNCSVRSIPDKSITANEILTPLNGDSDDSGGLFLGGHKFLVPQLARNRRSAPHIRQRPHFGCLIRSDVPGCSGQIAQRQSWLGVAKYLGVLILTFANGVRFNSCTRLLLNCEFNLLDDQALVRRVRTWDGNSSIPIQENDWFESVGRLLVGRSEVVDSKTLDSATLLSDHGWSIYRPSINLRKDPSEIGTSFIGRVQPAAEYNAGCTWTQLIFC